MTVTKPLYDGDQLPAIKRRLLAVISPGWKRLSDIHEDENEFQEHARADIAWLIADCERQRAENGVLAETIRADNADAALTAAQRERLAALETLAERVGEWARVPYIGPQSEDADESYDLRNAVAQDAVLEAYEAVGRKETP